MFPGNEITPRDDGGPVKWDGSIGIQLPDEREHEVVFRVVDGMAMSILGRMHTAKVTNNFGKSFTPSLSVQDTTGAAPSSA